MVQGHFLPNNHQAPEHDKHQLNYNLPWLQLGALFFLFALILFLFNYLNLFWLLCYMSNSVMLLQVRI